jgi:Flp pilus assembly protein CpaB
MQKQKVILIIGIILAITSLVIVKVYIDQKTQAVNDSARKKIESFKATFTENAASVLVAKDTIPKGTTIDAEQLDIKIIPRDYVQAQAISSLDRIAGMITVMEIPVGDQITLNKLAQPRQAGGLAEVTPVGKRAVTISVDSVSNLVGMLKPGDYVDVGAIVAVPVQTPQGPQTNIAVIPLFQNILVLAVGQDIGGPIMRAEGGRYKKDEKPPDPNPLITLALTPQEVSIMAFVQEQGKTRLTLRSPADSQIQATVPASWDTLFQYIMPSMQQQKPPEEEKSAQPVVVEESPKEEPKEKGDVVEIYRGLTRDTITIPR